MKPTLSILLFEDAEKDPLMTERFLFGIDRLNAYPALSSMVQLIAITQRHDSVLPGLLQSCSCRTHYVQPHHPIADNGYPIWDILSAVRQAWPYVDGEYVTFAHTEFIYGPHRISRTVEWLLDRKPILAMGNLRRLGVNQPHWRNRLLAPKHGLTDLLTNWIDASNAEALSAAWDGLPTTHWSHWRDGPRNDGQIDEDIFYARRDWLDTLRFFEQDDRQPFQDVYDLIRTADLILRGAGLAPRCYRMSRDVNEAIHLDHPRNREAYSLACYRWFLANRDHWLGTSYANDDLWSRILSPSATDEQRHKAISGFRHDKDGTVTRWAIAFNAWLKGGGAETIRNYYERAGRVQRLIRQEACA